MYIESLYLSHVRNLTKASFDFDKHFNLICGQNGAGKTAILEAIFLLGMGRSFRTHQIGPLITFEKSSCVVSAKLLPLKERDDKSPQKLGIERFRNGNCTIKINEEKVVSISELPQTLPLQLMNVQAFQVLEAGPQFRRQFLDWGVFHMEHRFLGAWNQYKRALKQRNAALKTSSSKQAYSGHPELALWERPLVEAGEAIHQYRQAYLEAYIPVAKRLLKALLPIQMLEIIYNPGWDERLGLEEALKNYTQVDVLFGATQKGPHRADLEVLVEGVPAKQVLSRGQLKLFIAGLLMARAELLYAQKGVKCVFLVDDLCSELDGRAAQVLIEGLEALGAQVLITGIEAEVLGGLLGERAYRVFHVEQGEVLLPTPEV